MQYVAKAAERLPIRSSHIDLLLINNESRTVVAAAAYIKRRMTSVITRYVGVMSSTIINLPDLRRHTGVTHRAQPATKCFSAPHNN